MGKKLDPAWLNAVCIVSASMDLGLEKWFLDEMSKRMNYTPFPPIRKMDLILFLYRSYVQK